MKKSSFVFRAVLLVAMAAGLQAATCTPTGFFRDSINMTAAVVNPPATVTGEVDATGCNIGVYYDQGAGAVKQANVHGSNYFGVVVNADSANVAVSVTDSNVHDIGEVPHNGTQHGVGIYYRALGAGFTASGTISGNTVTGYQKGGIATNGKFTGKILSNNVIGDGRVSFIAQNGIQVGYGADAQVKNNVVSGNAYTGLNFASSGGILVVGGDCYGGALTVGTDIVSNTLINNDVGVYLSNLDATCNAPLVPTNIKVNGNTITNDALTNVGAFGPSGGYQAGVSDQGNGDKISGNKISGDGYKAPGSAQTFAAPVDADPAFTNNAKVRGNPTPHK